MNTIENGQPSAANGPVGSTGQPITMPAINAHAATHNHHVIAGGFHVQPGGGSNSAFNPQSNQKSNGPNKLISISRISHGSIFGAVKLENMLPVNQNKIFSLGSGITGRDDNIKKLFSANTNLDITSQVTFDNCNNQNDTLMHQNISRKNPATFGGANFHNLQSQYTQPASK
jgi:hypothetical protein